MTFWSACWHNWPVVLATVLYMTEGFICFRDERFWAGIMWIGYSLANVAIMGTYMTESHFKA